MINPPPIQRRVFWALAGLGTVPLAVAVLIIADRARSSASPAGPRAALEEIAASSRDLLNTADSATVPAAVRAAIESHADIVSRRTMLARRADTLTQAAAGALAVLVLVTGVLTLAGAIWVARRWSQAIVTPVDEILDWIDLIGRGIPLPASSATAAPEYEQLRLALRTMSDNLQQARADAIERERLDAFRETARRVAHEVRGPLTSMRLALGQLEQTPEDASEILAAETDRLDGLAREFADFGRLAEGPTAPVDLHELVSELASTTVDPNVPVRCSGEAGVVVSGRYESLRRALQNILVNAAALTDERGVEIVTQTEAQHGTVRITDHGPGVPAAHREEIFKPYVTQRPGGTGLGLAIARQAITEHGGTIEVEDGPTGGASFVIRLPTKP